MAEQRMTKWKSCPSFPGFEASADGSLRHHGRDLHPRSVNDKGYLRACLSHAGPVRPVHQLVADAWLPPKRYPDDQVNHKDGDKTNNAAANLEWVTPSEQQRHAYRIGLREPTRLTGANNGQAKLSGDLVAQIRRLAPTMTHVDVAQLVGVSRSTVGRIVRGESWKD